MYSLGNIALGKNAEQSGTYYNDDRGVASKAVDGKQSIGGFEYCSHTGNTIDPAYWSVDLDGDFIIRYIFILNRHSQRRMYS